MQIEVYRRILGIEAVQNMIKKDDRCGCGTGKKYDHIHYPLVFVDLFGRRKDCCHPFAAGDLFKYMSALIKVSNHLALILPGELCPNQMRL
jgi:uncharacterized protein YchJ